MSDIQFIIEKPHKPVRTAKKRSRLITSCDACRLKKIKCRPTRNGDGQCQACEASDSACVFKERDHIRRLRGIASFTVAPTRHDRDDKPSVTAEPGPSFVAVDTDEGPSPSSSSSSPANSRPDHSAPNESAASDKCSDTFSFFDPQRQGYPNPRMLPHLVDLFLIYAGSIFPFFDPDETAGAAREGSLSPLIANCLAAYAARFSDEIRHFPGTRHLTGDLFQDVAKCLLSGPVSDRLERLHAIILIAWSENGAGRTGSFFTYTQMACSLAVELRLDSEEFICQGSSEAIRNRSRSTFWSVVWLEIIACSVTGNSCSLHLNECSTGMPNPEIKTYGHLPRDIMYQAFRGVLNLMASLIDFSNAGKPSTPSAHRDAGLCQMHRIITMFRDWLPSSLAFSKENLSVTMFLRESFTFYLVHVLLHCFLVILHCPSLFWASQPPRSIAEAPRLDIAWSSATAIVDILNLMQSENVLFTIGLSSTFMPLSIARGALLLAQSNAKRVLDGTGMTIEVFELTNRFYLEQTAQMLQNLSRYWGNMHQVEISAEPVALCGIQTVPRNQEAAPQLLKSMSLQYGGPPPSLGSIVVVPLRYLDEPKECDGHLQRSEEGWRTASSAACKEITTVDGYSLVRRYNLWQDIDQSSI